ncbi:MAG: hypothetical protein AB9873_13125 [Syntrophobacteraceae bacterium]
MQVIVGLEMKSDYGFDNIIALDTPYELLLESEFQAIEQLVDPMLKLMFNAL